MQIVVSGSVLVAQPAHARAATSSRSRSSSTSSATGRERRERVARAVRARRPRSRRISSATRTSSAAASGSASAWRARSRSTRRSSSLDEPVSALDVVGAGAGRQPADGSAAAADSSPTSSSRTTCGWCEHICSRVAVMYLGQDRRDGADRRRSSPRRSIRTRARCCRRSGAGSGRAATPDRRWIRSHAIATLLCGSCSGTSAPIVVTTCRRGAPHVVLDLAVADVDGAVGERGDVGFVRDEDDGVAGLVEPLEQRP